MEHAEAALRLLAAFIALFVEGIAVFFIFIGAIETVVLVGGRTTGLLAREAGWRRSHPRRCASTFFERWRIRARIGS